jgi:RHS repeat-associated protein
MGKTVLAAHNQAPQGQSGSRPRPAGVYKLAFTLTRGEGVVWRSYYYAGASRIAMREDSDSGTEVYYILTDHLGSTSKVVQVDGSSVSVTAQQWYKPWGETREMWGVLPTDRTFQGRLDPGWGLKHFGARWFDSSLGRFAQADSIIPGVGNPLAWDRYAGLRNNPVRYTDPSGHETCNSDGWCGSYNPNYDIRILSKKYGITFEGVWSRKDKLAVLTGAIVVAGALAKYTQLEAIDSFKPVFGSLTFARSSEDPGYWGAFNGDSTITFFAGAAQWTSLVAHELGHVFNHRVAISGGATPYNTIYNDGIWTADGGQVAGYQEGFTEPGTGETCNGQCYDNKGKPIPPNHHYRTMDGLDFNHSDTLTNREDFADTFANWATGSFDNSDAGLARLNFMTTNLSEWVTSAMGR